MQNYEQRNNALALCSRDEEITPLCNGYPAAPAPDAINFPHDARRRRRVLIADDHALLRVGLRALLAAEHAEVDIDEASCLQDALDVYRANPLIDLVLLDLNMSDCRGLQGLQRFRKSFPEAILAVFSATHDEFVIGQARALGATAYISKAYRPNVQAQMILALLCKDRGTEFAGFPGPRRCASYDEVAKLGPRHLEILDLVLFGCSNQEISTATHLKLGTVKNHVSIILLALDVKSRSHLVSLFG